MSGTRPLGDSQIAPENRRHRTWTFFLPGATLLLFAVFVTLPWGLDPELTYVPPLLILTMVFAWTIRHPTLMPGLIVFVIGVAVDVVTASPLGFWAFLFLCGYAVALHVARFDAQWQTLVIVMAYIPTSICIALLAWGLTSVYFAQLTDWTSLYASVTASWYLAPVVALMTHWFARWMAKPNPSGNLAQGQS